MLESARRQTIKWTLLAVIRNEDIMKLTKAAAKHREALRGIWDLQVVDTGLMDYLGQDFQKRVLEVLAVGSVEAAGPLSKRRVWIQGSRARAKAKTS